jgi:flagellar motor switch protein FliN/FliY
MTAADVQSILRLRVPVIVRLGHRQLSVSEVMNLAPGSMIELPQPADEPLDLMVNNKLIGQGAAVKIGENFGLKVSAVGDAAERIKALGPEDAAQPVRAVDLTDPHREVESDPADEGDANADDSN